MTQTVRREMYDALIQRNTELYVWNERLCGAIKGVIGNAAPIPGGRDSFQVDGSRLRSAQDVLNLGVPVGGEHAPIQYDAAKTPAENVRAALNAPLAT